MAKQTATNQFFGFLCYKRLFLLPMLIVLFASCQRTADTRSSQEKLVTDAMFIQYFSTLQDIDNMRLKSITYNLKQAGPHPRPDRSPISSADKKIKFLQMANSLKNTKGESYNQLLIRSTYLYTKLRIKYVNKMEMPKEQFKKVFLQKLLADNKAKNPVHF